MNKITLDFTTELEKDLARQHLTYNVIIFNKNRKVYKTYGFSSSFSIDEIYKKTKEKYKNKIIKLEIIIN